MHLQIVYNLRQISLLYHKIVLLVFLFLVESRGDLLTRFFRYEFLFVKLVLVILMLYFLLKLRRDSFYWIRFFRFAYHKLINVNQHISGFARVFLTSDWLFQNHFFSFYCHRVVIEPPPNIFVPVVNEAIVMTKLSWAIMHKYCMQIVWLLTKIFECSLNLLFEHLNSLFKQYFAILNFLFHLSHYI